MKSATNPSPGNIPACAGTTGALVGEACSFREHPRMRGDHWIISMSRATAMGTSPHARGPLSADAKAKVLRGNIPACAGTTA